MRQEAIIMKTIEITDQEKIEAILSKANICFVGMTGGDGAPYVIPMNFGYEEGVFYLHSGQHGRKMEALKQNPRVCIAVSVGNEIVYQHPDVACSHSVRAESVVAEGLVEFIEDLDEKAEALNIFMRGHTGRDYTYSAPALKNVVVWRVKPQKINSKCKGFGLQSKKQEN